MADPFKPYVNTTNENDAMIVRVPTKQMDIGANSASMPSGLRSGDKGLQHVGNQNSK